MDYYMVAALVLLVGRFPSGGQSGEIDTIIGPGADGKNVLYPLGFGRVCREGSRWNGALIVANLDFA